MRLWRNFGSTLALALACALPHSASNAQEQEEAPDFAAMAREDIEEAYAVFAEHHPGMYNPLDPEFGERLQQFRDDALAFADTVEDGNGHFLAVRRFSQSLGDGHARASIGYNGNGALWPGFHTVWRGDTLLVSSEIETGPPVGSALVSCEGRDADTLIEEQAFQLFGYPGEAGHWWQFAPHFFRRTQPLVTGEPQSCLFRTPAGTETEYALEWEMMPLEELLSTVSSDDRLQVGMTEPRDGLVLISLPTFSPDDEGQAAYEAMFSAIDQRIGEIAEARAIILDLRWNGGGSSSWSHSLAGHLWGEEAVEWALAQYFSETEVWYLADDANISHFSEGARTLRERGIEPIAEALEEYVTNLSGARERGETFYRDQFGAAMIAEVSPSDPRPLPPVYVITEGGCASACLDAVDVFTLFDGVRLIGAPTSSDTEYLEVRRQPAPNGRVWLTIPTKIWVNRPRGSGEAYVPDIPVTELVWSTDVFLDHIERDLAGE